MNKLFVIEGAAELFLYSRAESLNNYLKLLPFIRSFIQQIVSILYYMPGSILGTRESVGIKTD